MGYALNTKTGKYEYVSGEGNSNENNVVMQTPESESSEVGAIAENKKAKDEYDVSGRGKAKGDRKLRKYTKIKIDGLGNIFNGIYFLSEVTHTISTNGYEVDFSIKTKKENIGKTSDTETTTGSPSEANGRQPDYPENNSSEYELDPISGKYILKKKVSKKPSGKYEYSLEA